MGIQILDVPIFLMVKSRPVVKCSGVQMAFKYQLSIQITILIPDKKGCVFKQKAAILFLSFEYWTQNIPYSNVSDIWIVGIQIIT